MNEHAVLYNRNNLILIRHLKEENTYSLGTFSQYESYQSNKGLGFPVDEAFVTAEQLIDRVKAWQEIDKKNAGVNHTYEAEQEIIDVLERELVKETDIVIDFKNIINELKAQDVHLCSVNSEVHNWGLCLEDNEKNLYQMEGYYFLSYPNHLIEHGAVVKFERVDPSISKNVGEWERNVWKESDLLNFIKRERLESKVNGLGVDMSNEALKGKSAAFVRVYKLVKEARLPNADTKALEDIRDKFGYDLYKEALDVVLKEQSAGLYSQMKNVFDMLPGTLNKNKMTPYVFFENLSDYAYAGLKPFQELKSSLEHLKLSFIDDEFIEMFNDIQSHYKPPLSVRIKSAEGKSAANDSARNVPGIEPER